MKRMVLAGALAASLSGNGAGAACAPQDPKAVTDTVRTMFAALEARDAAGVKASLSDDFYAFDGGKRFDGQALPQLIAGAQAAGKVYHWSVNDPDVRLMCDRAFIAYANRGSITDAQGSKPVSWLESALLRYEGGRWRIAFLHSTRTTP